MNLVAIEIERSQKDVQKPSAPIFHGMLGLKEERCMITLDNE